MTKLKLLLVDDHAIFREGLRLLLANISPDLEIEDAGTLSQAVEACRRTSFRMVLLDLDLSGSSGLATLQRFREQVADVPVVVLSGDQEPALIRQCIEVGAVGFVPKAYSSELMIAALQYVLAGGIYLPALAIASGGGAASNDRFDPSSFAKLSERQQEVAHLLLQGQSNKLIARRLNISEGTVKAHVSAIFQIIGVHTRVEAVLLAAKHGLKVM